MGRMNIVVGSTYDTVETIIKKYRKTNPYHVVDKVVNTGEKEYTGGKIFNVYFHERKK